MSAPAHNPANYPAALAALVALIEKSVRGMDQKLGYHGKDRFVLFYYEPRGQEVIWRDSHSYGFATGAGPLFVDELAPVADVHNVNVGSCGERGTHVLLIDRKDQRAYFAERNEAERFLAGIAEPQRDSGPGAPAAAAAGDPLPTPLAPLTTLVEITHESISELAYAIWEKNGRVEGKNLQDWLEAEAQLRTKRWALLDQ